MPTEAGYSNTKKQGRTAWKTLHPLGSSRVGQHVVTKSLVERQAIPVAITAVTQNTTDTLIRIELAGHGALVGDIARFYTGALQGAELEIVSVVDVDNFVVRNLVGVPAVTDTIKVMYYVTPKSDAEGNVNFSPGPTTYSFDGVVTTVATDTANAGNNRALPTLTSFYRDGVQRFVNEDTVDPANNTPLPVKISGITGDVNITAGDLNVNIEATNDSTAIGDGVTGELAKVDLNDDATTYALKVKDDDANTALATIGTNTSGLATEVTLALLEAKDFATETTLALIEGKDFATETTLTAVDAKLGTIDADTSALALTVNQDGNPVGTSGVMVGGEDASGDFQNVRVNTNGELSVTFGTAGFATETTLSALNNKVANNYGASSGAVRTAAQVGNATGAADFGVGADGAQTLRVSANLKRAGNELAYNSGAADANTLRSVLATRHEAAATPLSNRLSDGTDFISSEAIAAAQKTLATLTKTLSVVSIGMGWDGSQHREILVNGVGQIEAATVPQTINGSYDELLTISDAAALTFTPPAGAVRFKIMADADNNANLRMKIGGTATATSGIQLQGGRSEDFEMTGVISIITEAGGSACKAYVQWGVN